LSGWKYFQNVICRPSASCTCGGGRLAGARTGACWAWRCLATSSSSF